MNKEELMTLPTLQGTSHCSCLEHCFLFILAKKILAHAGSFMQMVPPPTPPPRLPKNYHRLEPLPQSWNLPAHLYFWPFCCSFTRWPSGPIMQTRSFTTAAGKLLPDETNGFCSLDAQGFKGVEFAVLVHMSGGNRLSGGHSVLQRLTRGSCALL